MPGSSAPTAPPTAVARAIRLSYGQAMLSAVYVASTGGMFIIGYALKLGATNVQIGLMSTVPMFFVLAQLLGSVLVERGLSRRTMTIVASLANASCWVLVILIPYLGRTASPQMRIAALIAIITVVTAFAQIANNARGSWLGDLIPADARGTFFGRINMYAGIVGTAFALIEGAFLDRVKLMGIGAFGWLFGFGMLFGLSNSLLFVPQPDFPLDKSPSGTRFMRMVRGTFANRPFMLVMTWQLLWAMQSVAWPFYATYMLRDLKMPFLGVGAVNAVVTLTLLAVSPFWGRIVDRYGSRPVLIACSAAMAPVPLVWFFADTAARVYAIIPPVNLLVGFCFGGVFVAVSTLMYKVTPSVGRSVQFAIYSAVVMLAAAPMPAFGGYLPDLLRRLGLHADLRMTFYLAVPFVAAAAWVARRISEPDSRRTTELIRNLPRHLRRPATLRPGG
jgi:hypothetical protein